MSHSFSSRKDDRRAVLQRFLLVFVPLTLIILAIGMENYVTELKVEQVTRETDEAHYVDMARQTITSELRGAISDLTFLVKLNELQTWLDEPGNDRARLGLARELRHFSEKKGVYDQIRLLAPDGMERIRVNYNNGAPETVPDDQLQNKAHRYYFREALDLDPDLGQLYMSPFDLNVEDQRIQEPPNPVIRLATRLYDSHGNRAGILMVNFMGTRLMQHFKQSVAAIGDHVHLVNNEGYWLSAPDPKDEWAFMFGKVRTIQQDHPDAWRRIRSETAGRFYNATGLYTYATIDPVASVMSSFTGFGTQAVMGPKQALGREPVRVWKIVAHLPAAELTPTPLGFLREHLLYYGSSLLLLMLVSYVLARTAVQRNRAQAQHEYERRFRNTLETIDLAAVTISADGRILFCNDHLLALTGWTRDDVIGKDWFDTFLPEADRAPVRDAFERVLSGEALPAAHEDHIRTQDGHELLMAWNNTLSRGPDGTVNAVTSIGEDITDQRWNEQQLRKLSLAVEQSTNPVLITDRNGIIEYVNRTFTDLTGYAASEVIGKRPSILKSGETSQKEYRKLWETITSGREWRGLFHNRTKGGELYWEYTVITPIKSPEGAITHFLAIKEDVTKIRRLESEVESRKQELEDSRTMAVLGRMASMVAHDLRNPLSSVKMTLQILGKRTRDTGDAEARELKQIALDQVHYMEEILADMLAFASAESVKPKGVSINKLLGTAMSSNGGEIRKHGARVTTDYGTDLPDVYGDATKLRRVFSNLIVNALEATDGTGRTPEIRIRTVVLDGNGSGPRVRVEITDNGVGLDPDEAVRVFEPFYTTRSNGTGLGLAIVQRVLKQHHGTIELCPGEAGGTSAILTLPTEGAKDHAMGH